MAGRGTVGAGADPVRAPGMSANRAPLPSPTVFAPRVHWCTIQLPRPRVFSHLHTLLEVEESPTTRGMRFGQLRQSRPLKCIKTRIRLRPMVVS